MKPKIAITAGDTNGVGYEIILKTFNEPHLLEVCTPIIYGSARIASVHRKTLEDINVNVVTIGKAQDAQERKMSIINCGNDNVEVQFGTLSPKAGQAAFEALERACADLKAGVVDALVTAPINKASIQSDSFQFHGHTEYLTEKFADENEQSLMMLVNESMRVALVTNHLAITQVAQNISSELIQTKLQLLNASLKTDFNIRKPRIAVLSLNPHAGDDGLLGDEEQKIIIPALQAASEAGILALGPYAADGFFGAGKYKNFDAILAMYHDQGLIPFKAFDMNGVNFTAGLPIVRTSPDHGTAYEIAGKNQANEQSFRQAVYAAIDILANRKMNAEVSANPLQIREKRTSNRE